jgi:hypothetical protein
MVATVGEEPRLAEHGVDAVEAELVRSLHCATKPMVALAFMSLLERTGLPFSTSWIDPEGQLGDTGRWRVAELLAHRSELRGPTVWEAMRLPLGSLEGALDASLARTSRYGGPTGYSDVLAWFLLVRAGSRLAGSDVAHDVEAAARDVVGPRLWLWPDRELLDLPREAMTTVAARHGVVPVPLVFALTRRARALTSPYLGGYGSFAALVGWFRALAAHLAWGGSASALFPSSAYFFEALGSTRPDDGYAASFERLQGEGVDGELLGVQAAGGSLSVRLEPSSGAVVAVLGDTFIEDPALRARWLQDEWQRASTWAVVGAPR